MNLYPCVYNIIDFRAIPNCLNIPSQILLKILRPNLTLTYYIHTHTWHKSLQHVFTLSATSLRPPPCVLRFSFSRWCESQKTWCFFAAPRPHKQPVYNCLGQPLT